MCFPLSLEESMLMRTHFLFFLGVYISHSCVSFDSVIFLLSFVGGKYSLACVDEYFKVNCRVIFVFSSCHYVQIFLVHLSCHCREDYHFSIFTKKQISLIMNGEYCLTKFLFNNILHKLKQILKILVKMCIVCIRKSQIPTGCG